MKAYLFAAFLIFAGASANAKMHKARRTPTVPRIRESLLQEANVRLKRWYQVKSQLQLPMWRDGVKIQISKDDVLCGAPGDLDPIPVTFGEFEVADARPVDVFNTLANHSNQKSWDTTLRAVTHVGDWEDEGVVGLNYVYPAGLPLIPDREMWEWAAVSANFAQQDFMIVLSTLANGRLQAVHQKRDDTVLIQNCLAAYWARPNLDGGTLVTFTHHINVHPEFGFSQRFIFGFMWSKDVDWVNIMRAAAQAQSKQNRSLKETAAPSFGLRGPPLPRVDPHRKPVSEFNLTEKGDFIFENGAGQEMTSMRLVQTALCLILCATVCLVSRACWTHFIDNLAQPSRAETSAKILEMNAQDSDSEEESDSVVPQLHGNCRCLTIAS